MKTVTAASRWKSLEQLRSTPLRRAIDCSKLTIPSCIPESDQNYGSLPQTYNKLPSLYQGAGARGVSNLSSKIGLALYPPNQPFFKLVLDKAKVQQQLAQMGDDASEIISQLDLKLASYERQIMQKLDELQARPAIAEAIRHLVIGGNAMLHVGKDSIRMFGLRSYVVDRDPEGNVRELVIREQVSREFLPITTSNKEEGAEEEFCDVYTHVTMDPDEDRCEWYQEYDGRRLQAQSGFSKMDACPYLILRLHRVAGEAFGRGIVEEALGDLQSLESLSQAIVQGSLIAAKAVALVNPNGTTRADAISRAENGAVVAGNSADVEFLTVNKNSDFATALQTMQMIEKRLNFVFLNNEAATRDASRVTAEEIRLMATQLESGLSGTYSVLAHELQLPLVKRVMHIMGVDGALPAMPKGLIEPVVQTGLEAIGRGNDKARLTNFIQTIGAALGPEALMQYVDPSELIRRFAASDGIDTDGLVKTDDDLQNEQAQQQQLMLEEQLAQGAIANGATTATPVPQGPPPQGGAGSPAGVPAAPAGMPAA
jgi:hypothetical protein